MKSRKKSLKKWIFKLFQYKYSIQYKFLSWIIYSFLIVKFSIMYTKSVVNIIYCTVKRIQKAVIIIVVLIYLF